MKKIFKKIIPYIFVLIILFGISFLSFSKKAEAQEPPKGTCSNIPNHTPSTETNTTEGWCDGVRGTWTQNPNGTPEPEPTPVTNPEGSCNLSQYKTPTSCAAAGGTWGVQEKQGNGYKTEFEKKVAEDYECGIFDGDLYPGCFVQLFYGLFYTIPSALLWLSAYFFNVLLSITISSDLFKSDFLNTAWGVVRDLSNLFFLIVLLYIAIRIILDIDSHGIKKTIANVVVMALLINFSMFFTKVIIDTSNVLALVFYNKMTVTTKDANGNERLYTKAAGEKDISGGIVGSFNPTSLLTAEFFDTAGTVIVPNSPPQPGKISPGMLIMVLLITGAIMLYAAYAFLIAGLSFLGRMIELFVLIVFSPFAFMSFAVPFLRNTEHIGWDKWLHSLLKSSFMAPIFMFFMYFIFLVTKSKDVFGSMINGTSTIQKILLLVLPALFILRLLSIATGYAKKGSGAIGESIIKYSKAVAGVALGAATGGAALGAMSTVGAVSNKVAKMDGLKDAANEKGMKGWAAKMALKTVDAGSKSSFDLRNTKLGQKLSSATGIKMSPDSLNMVGLGPRKGGWEGVVKRGAEKREKELARESELLKTKKSDDEIKKEYAEKQEAYDKAKKEATKNGMSEADFEKKHGKRPVAYEKAEQLNHARMERFKENFAERGLVASLAHTLTKKVTEENFKDSPEYKNWQKETEEAKAKPDYDEEKFKKSHPEPTVESVNKDRVKKTKLIIGSAAAVVGVASGGVAFAGMGGLSAGVIAGAGIKAGVEKVAEAVTGARAKGEKEFFKKEEKHEKKMKAVEQQIKSMKELLKDQTIVMENAEFLKDGITTEEKGKTDEHGNKLYKVNTDKLSEKIVGETEKIEALTNELTALNNKKHTSGSNSAIETRINEISMERKLARFKLLKLEALKGADKKAADLRIQISKIDDKKHQIEHEHEAETEKMLKKDESGGGGGHEEKKHEDHPAKEHPEPSGGGHGGGGGDHGGGGAHGGGGGGHH